MSSKSKTALNRELDAFGLSQVDIEKVLKLALANGGALAELFFEDSDATRLIFEDSHVEKVIQGRDRGCGLRILFNNRSVYGYTTDLEQSSLETLASTLAAAVDRGSDGSEPDFSEWRSAEQPIAEIANYRIKRDPRQATLLEKKAICERADRSARAACKDAKQVTVMFLDKLRKILVLNSDGLISKDEKTYAHLVCEVVATRDDVMESALESDGGYVGMEFFEGDRAESIAGSAARQVNVLLSAVPAPSGSMPVVLAAEAGGTMIHEAVGHGLEADLACNGLSVYQGKVGQMVASPLITVIDDGTLPERRGSYAFDDEGTASKKTVLIENGILKGFLVDRLSAMKFDLPATGNGRRETFRNKPIVRMTNTYIAPGKHDPAEILRETKLGIFVKAMGGGQVNTVTGDFVFAVTEGYLIRDGKIAEPIRGATLVGNGPEIMKKVDRVGTDLGFATGTCGKDGQGAPVTDAQPTLRIPEMTVGGEVPMDRYWTA